MKKETKDAVTTGGIGLGFTVVGAFLSVFASYAAQKMIMNMNSENKKAKRAQQQTVDNDPEVIDFS